LFRERGRSVFSADEIATQLTRSDPKIQVALRGAFGPQAFTPHGKLDRHWLASEVFRNKVKLRKLNAIVHPRVLSVLRQQIRQLPPSKRHPFTLVESALVFEAGLENMFDLILVVHSALSIRISRVRAQTGLTRPEILRRVANQLSPAEARKMADFSVSNSGNLANLRRAVLILDRLFLSLARNPPKKQ